MIRLTRDMKVYLLESLSRGEVDEKELCDTLQIPNNIMNVIVGSEDDAEELKKALG